MLKMHPISHRVIVEERIFEKKTRGGIALPDHLITQYQNAQNEGKIIEMASDAFEDYPEGQKPEIGDIVYFGKYDGIGKVYKDIPFRILADDMIYAVSKQYINHDEDLYAEINC